MGDSWYISKCFEGENILVCVCEPVNPSNM